MDAGYIYENIFLFFFTLNNKIPLNVMDAFALDIIIISMRLNLFANFFFVLGILWVYQTKLFNEREENKRRGIYISPSDI